MTDLNRKPIFDHVGPLIGGWDATKIAAMDRAIDAALGMVAAPAISGTVQSPEDYVSTTLMAHEGKLSVDTKDRGNWFNGQLVGSKYGITGAALAKYRGVKSITAQQMAALTKAEAIQIALADYYHGPKIDELEWNAVTCSVLDMGYNAGPGTAIKLLQRMIGVNNDGGIGPFTDRAYSEYIEDHGVVKAAEAYCDARLSYYDAIIRARPANAKYRNGWKARAQSFTSSSPWWKQFHGGAA